LQNLNENESDAKLKKKNENTNECIRNFYFSLLFSLLPIIVSVVLGDKAAKAEKQFSVE